MKVIIVWKIVDGLLVEQPKDCLIINRFKGWETETHLQKSSNTDHENVRKWWKIEIQRKIIGKHFPKKRKKEIL